MLLFIEKGFYSPNSLYPRRWGAQTNLGSERIEQDTSQAPVQNVAPQTHANMCQRPRLVGGNRPEGRVLSCLDPSEAQAVSSVCLQREGISVQDYEGFHWGNGCFPRVNYWDFQLLLILFS